MLSDYIRTAGLWQGKGIKGSNSALGLFASLEIIIDNEHRDMLVDEIQERMEQVGEHKAMIETLIAEEKNLKSFMNFAKNTEIVVDYDR